MEDTGDTPCTTYIVDNTVFSNLGMRKQHPKSLQVKHIVGGSNKRMPYTGRACFTLL